MGIPINGKTAFISKSGHESEDRWFAINVIGNMALFIWKWGYCRARARARLSVNGTGCMKSPRIKTCGTSIQSCHFMFICRWQALTFSYHSYHLVGFARPQPLGSGAIMLSGRPSIRPSACPKCHLSTQTWVCWSIRPTLTVFLFVRPSVRRGFRTCSQWPKVWHADVSWPLSELIRFWSRSVDLSNFDAIFT